MIKIISISGATAIVASLFVLVMHQQFAEPNKKFASVDLRKVMSIKLDSYKERLEKGESVPAEDAAKFADALEHTMNSIESDTSTIILNSPAVISGVVDMTPVVIEMINAELDAHEADKY